MNDWVVVDANVIVKAFVSEIGSDAAGRLWASEALFVAPAHALAEVGEAFRRKLGRREITPEQWHEASLALPNTILPIGLGDLFGPAMTISVELSLSFYDALYVAAAERWDCPLVTADERVIDASAKTKWSGRVLSLDSYDTAHAR